MSFRWRQRVVNRCQTPSEAFSPMELTEIFFSAFWSTKKSFPRAESTALVYFHCKRKDNMSIIGSSGLKRNPFPKQNCNEILRHINKRFSSLSRGVKINIHMWREIVKRSIRTHVCHTWVFSRYATIARRTNNDAAVLIRAWLRNDCILIWLIMKMLFILSSRFKFSSVARKWNIRARHYPARKDNYMQTTTHDGFSL